jgi:hypothetical protein
MSLSNIQLDQMARDLNIPLISVSFKDQIPYPPREGVYIVNLQSSTQGCGSHWSGIILNKSGSFYFDSFGEPPPKETQRFIQTFDPHFGYNSKEIQDLNSDLCGFFCMGLFLSIQKDKKKKPMFEKVNDYLKNFSHNTKENDAILRKFFTPYKKQRVLKMVLFRK